MKAKVCFYHLSKTNIVEIHSNRTEIQNILSGLENTTNINPKFYERSNVVWQQHLWEYNIF